MTMTPREIQEKQFHDAFRGYNHEEVDLFIDQVADAYEAIYKENQNFNRRLEELKGQVSGAPVASAPAPAVPQPAAPVPSAGRSESEDMLKRMLVTAQETADKAVANARAKAQMLVDEAEIKARRIEEQADAVSSTALQDAQRRARDMLQVAQQEEGELRDRIEGMKSFEREFRTRLSAFIRSQLELLESKPLISAGTPGPVTSPFFDRGRLLNETIEKFGDYGLPASRPAAGDLPDPAPPESGNAEPETESEPDPLPPSQDRPISEWLSDAGARDDALAETADETPPSWSAPSPEVPAGEPTQQVVVAAASEPAAEEKEARPKKAASTESKSIHELFWGED